MWVLRALLLYGAFCGLVTAHYKVLSESPTGPHSSQKSTPIFAGEIFLTTLNSLKKSIEARKTRLATLRVDFETTDFLEIDPLTLDATQMTRSKSVLVFKHFY